MNIDEIKTFMVQLEAEKKQEVKEEIAAKRTTTSSRSNQENRCHRFNKLGHWSNECHFKEKGLWFCYYCQQIKDHKGDDCPFGNDGRKFKSYNKNHAFSRVKER